MFSDIGILFEIFLIFWKLKLRNDRLVTDDMMEKCAFQILMYVLLYYPNIRNANNIESWM